MITVRTVQGVTVITGAASGMGLACARRLAPSSDVLVLADLNPVDATALGIAGDVHVEQVDVVAAVLFASVAGHVFPATDDMTLQDILAEPLAEDAGERFSGAPALGGDPGLAYGLAKQAVLGLARRKATSWAARGARINSVSPGSIDTPMGQQELAGQPMMREMLVSTPIDRLGTADEVAAAVEFLLSDAASYITGTDLLVDGGVTALLRQ